MDTELFRGWLTDHFLEHAVGVRPLLVLLDGHSSHFQPDLIRFAREHDIILFCLPPHTTHESQPLDASVFKPLKQNWQDACHDYVQTHPGKAVTKYQFSELLHKAWDKTMTPTVICAGFRRCGVYPFNPQAIDCSISTDNPEATLTRPSDQQPEKENDFMENGDENTVTEFSVEQEERFRERFEEGYDLIDPEYLRWLEINHPDSIPADRHMLVLAPESSADVSEDNPTLTDVFSFVQPSSPIPTTECATPSNSPSIDSSTLHASSATKPGITNPSHGSTTESVKTPPTLESTPRASTTESLKTPPTLESTPRASTTESVKTPPTLESTPRASTTESVKTPPTLESTPGASTTESVKTPPTLESTPRASTTESLKTPPTLESTPRASTTESLKTPPTLESTPRASTTESIKTPPTLESTPRTSTKESIKTPPNNSPILSLCTKTPVTTPGSVPSSVGTSSGESDSELRYISKYLVQVISNATPKSSASTAKRVSGARVLTSAKCAAILEEREQKKKKEIEEKEKRKVEREQKKKEKEDAAKKKVEERARKAEEAAKKRESRAKKRTMLASAASSQAKKRKESAAAAGTSATTDPRASTSSSDPGTSTSTRSRNSSHSSAAAAHSGTSEDDTTINSNVCCVCYRTFEEDRTGMGAMCLWEVAT